VLDRVLAWFGVAHVDDDTDPGDGSLDWTDPDAAYGGEGPPRRYNCPECGGTMEGTGPDAQVTCPDCATVFKRVLVPDHAVCPDCGARIGDAAFSPETRQDTEFADCDACGYRWESDPR
jgi:DNA-directed RNA polymerase subunit RPC12/RpoP